MFQKTYKVYFENNKIVKGKNEKNEEGKEEHYYSIFEIEDGTQFVQDFLAEDTLFRIKGEVNKSYGIYNVDTYSKLGVKDYKDKSIDNKLEVFC